MARMPASAPGPKIATNSSAQMMVLTERLVTRMTRPSQSVALVRRGVLRRDIGDRQRQDHARARGDGGDVHRLDEDAQNGADIGEIGRDHAAEQVAHLLRRVEKPGPVDLDAFHRPGDGGDNAGKDQEPREALARREADPLFGRGVEAHHMRFLTWPLTASLMRMAPTMTMVIASAKS